MGQGLCGVLEGLYRGTLRVWGAGYLEDHGT